MRKREYEKRVDNCHNRIDDQERYLEKVKRLALNSIDDKTKEKNIESIPWK